jgi:hypothetical protein
MIIRVQKRENPYVQIDKRPLEDMRLSWRAKGILAYLLSKPDSWTVQASDILNHGTEGRDAVRSAMGELRNLGYAKLINTSGGREWVISEVADPCPENPSMGMEPCPEKANDWKSATSNNDISVSNNKGVGAFALEVEGDGKKKRTSSDLFADLLPPEWLTNFTFSDAWKSLVESRRVAKKPFNDKAVKLIVTKMRDIAERYGGIEAVIQALHESIEKGWLTVYETKNLKPIAKPVPSANSQPERWDEFLASHPMERVRAEFKSYAATSPAHHQWIRAQFGRWLKTGSYSQ